MKIDYRQIFLDIGGILLYLSAVILNIWWLTIYVLFFIWVTVFVYLVVGLFMFHPEFRKDIDSKNLPYPYWLFMIFFFTKLSILAFGGWYFSSIVILIGGIIHYMAFYRYTKE